MPDILRLAGLFALAASLLCCTREIEPPDPFPTEPGTTANARDDRARDDGEAARAVAVDAGVPVAVEPGASDAPSEPGPLR